MKPELQQALDAYQSALADLNTKQSAASDAQAALAASASNYNASIDAVVTAFNGVRQS